VDGVRFDDLRHMQHSKSQTVTSHQDIFMATKFAPPPAFRRMLLLAFLAVYLLIGVFDEIAFINARPLPEVLLGDFAQYQRALSEAEAGQNPYAVRTIGPAYLYPPPSLLVIELFSFIKWDLLQQSLFIVVNLFLLGIMTHGIARYFGLTLDQTWYWYPLVFGFAPFLEMLHLGQINMVVQFCLYLLFIAFAANWMVAGIGLGLAIVLKASPVLFLWVVLTTRSFKVMASTLVVNCNRTVEPCGMAALWAECILGLSRCFP
jgi:hypothetical protein